MGFFCLFLLCLFSERITSPDLWSMGYSADLGSSSPCVRVLGVDNKDMSSCLGWVLDSWFAYASLTYSSQH